MTKVGIIRCEKNENKCPLTNCFKCLDERTQGYTRYDETKLAGVFTCRCPGDNLPALAKILKAKGAETLHFATCIFANNKSGGWSLEGGGFCDNARLEALMENITAATGLPCHKGTAHLPKDFVQD